MANPPTSTPPPAPRADPATGRSRTIVDTVADNAANAGLVTGQPFAPVTFDPRWAGAIVQRNGVVEETGLGAGVLNQPALGVAWLANRLALYGQRIEPGQIVLSGSFIRLWNAAPAIRSLPISARLVRSAVTLPERLPCPHPITPSKPPSPPASPRSASGSALPTRLPPN